jgi:hypothetical protein
MRRFRRNFCVKQPAILCRDGYGTGYTGRGTYLVIELVLRVSGGSAYKYMEDLLSLDACRTPNTDKELPPGLQEIITPLKWQEWDKA